MYASYNDNNSSTKNKKVLSTFLGYLENYSPNCPILPMLKQRLCGALFVRNYLQSSSSSSSVFCPKAGPSLQAEKSRLQFCRRQFFHRKLRNQGCSFTRDLIGAVASRCFPHPTLSLASQQILKDLKRSQGHQRGDEESGFG